MSRHRRHKSTYWNGMKVEKSPMQCQNKTENTYSLKSYVMNDKIKIWRVPDEYMTTALWLTDIFKMMFWLVMAWSKDIWKLSECPIVYICHDMVTLSPTLSKDDSKCQAKIMYFFENWIIFDSLTFGQPDSYVKIISWVHWCVKSTVIEKKAAWVGQNGRLSASCNFLSFWLIKPWGTTNYISDRNTHWWI